MRVDINKVFGIAVRIVFLFAFGAFLYASISHVASFFHNFEPSDVGWSGSYALAISIDGTALILTVGMMFFAGNMAIFQKVFIWLAILGLTGFSWVVNWEYAVTYQSQDFVSHLDPAWKTVNPILASCFALLNLAYAIISDAINFRRKTVAELQAELDDFTSRESLEKQLKSMRGPGLIQRAKNTAMEVKKAAGEVLKNEAENTQIIASAQPQNVASVLMPEPAQNIEQKAPVEPQKVEAETEQNPDISTAYPGQEKYDLTVEFLTEYPSGTDEDLARFLGFKRTMSATFLKLLVLHNRPELAFQKEDVSPVQNTPIPDSATSQKFAAFEAGEIEIVAPVTDPTLQAVSQGKTTGPLASNRSEKNGSKTAQKTGKIGLTFYEAARLEICQKKGIKSSDIRRAVLAKNIVQKSDGTVAKTAVESWAKTFTKTDEKQPVEMQAI